MALPSDPNMQSASHGRIGLLAQLTEPSSALRRIDIIVLALILGFGVLQFFYSERARDFLDDDVDYAEAGRSLIEHGFYGFNGQPRLNQPPGLPAILGLLCVAGGDSHIVFLRAMAVFATLGFMASYELLRRQVPRVVAAAICLLLISSPATFRLATQWVCPAYPYFFTTIGALLVARKLEEATHIASRIWLGVLLAVLTAASLIFASSGVALLGGIVASICAVYFWDRRLAFARLRTYLAVLLVGIAVQGLWMHQKLPNPEWPLPSHQDSYLAQLKMKSGNQPESGFAAPRDIAIRIIDNASVHSNLLSIMLFRRSTPAAWLSIFVVGPLVLIILGWCASIRKTGGGLQEWYFAGYEFMYFLWPWLQETRFFLPVAPLACLYLWRGGEALVMLAEKKPRVMGVVWLPMGTLLTACTWLRMRGYLPSHLPYAGLRDDPSVVVWLFSAILAAWMVWANTAWLTSASAFLRRFYRPIGALRISPLRISESFGIIVVAGLIILGLTMQIEIGGANLDLNSATNRLTPDAEAGAWIRSHTDENAVVMARLVPTVYHYSKRKVVWFYPSTNPKVLMEGIQRNRIEFVVVVQRENNYYLPPDDDCFTPLLTAYPGAFRMVYQAPEIKIFQVTANPSVSPKLG